MRWTVEDLGRFLGWLRTDDSPALVSIERRSARFSEATIALRLQAVCSFYRYQHFNGVEAASRLYERVFHRRRRGVLSVHRARRPKNRVRLGDDSIIGAQGCRQPPVQRLEPVETDRLLQIPVRVEVPAATRAHDHRRLGLEARKRHNRRRRVAISPQNARAVNTSAQRPPGRARGRTPTNTSVRMANDSTASTTSRCLEASTNR
jgi:hypothetical protein